MTPGTIMHEVVHRLGFDHEHSRFDREEFIEVRTENLRGSHQNFAINKSRLLEMFLFCINDIFCSKILIKKKVNAENVYDSPYDFLSITHYNSDVQQIDKGKDNILSKVT